ncbi:MAG: hydrogenase [Firmicutes bacterium]|nr:hydrogenase [Bacillota bacterium]
MNIMNFSAANCKSCYKCLRSCPVKAIKFKNDQAEIIEDRCIACSHCLLVCPQNARNVVSYLPDVKNAVITGRKVVASIAPSFAGYFDFEPGKFPGVLKNLGFSFVEETAVGAEVVSDFYMDYVKNTSQGIYITTACPSVNYLVEKYYPTLTEYLIPAVSPMIAHGKLIKQFYGEDCYSVFIGPCMAKKTENVSFFNDGAIDAVLNFDEIQQWIQDSGLDPLSTGASAFDRNTAGRGRSFPEFGGIIECMGEDIHKQGLRIITVSGSDECTDLFTSISNGDIGNIFVEASSCKGSCTGGPDMVRNEHSYYKRQGKVKQYLESRKSIRPAGSENPAGSLNLERTFCDKSFRHPMAYEHDIKVILSNMGKHGEEDELNCGVCGYNTCREKAQAIFEGMAEPNMCLHHMRTKAESITNVIFEHTANCTLLLDGDMNIIEMNPACRNAFLVDSEKMKGLPVAALMDDECFREVRRTGESIIGRRVAYPSYNLIFIQSIVYLAKQDMLMVSMVNIADREEERKKYNTLREKTLISTQEVIDKQMRVAHEIASLLGETTAETKTLLTKLKRLVEAEEEGN